MIRACFPFAAHNAIGYYRLALPVMVLSPELPVRLLNGIVPLPGQIAKFDEVEGVQTATIVVSTPYYPGMLEKLRALVAAKYRVVVDLDDNAWAHKSCTPEQLLDLNDALRLAHQVVTTTPFLQKQIRRHTGVTASLLRNALHSDAFTPPMRREGDRLRVLYTGAIAHRHEWPLIARLAKRTQDFCDWFAYMGNATDTRGKIISYVRPQRMEGAPVTWLPPQNAVAFMSRAQRLKANVTVAPLKDTEANKGKSDLKLIEAGALGIPCVASRLTPYLHSPNPLVANLDGFVEVLRRMHSNEDYRMEQATALVEMAWSRRANTPEYLNEVRTAWGI